jgi:hypothetical protein
MLKSQTIQLEQSRRRERMAAIQNTDGDLNADAVTELRSLTSAYETGEVQLRAAILTEGAERETIKATDKAGDDFARECRSFSLSNVVAAITDGKPITGREAEVSQELEQRNGAGHKGGVLIPWEALTLETRADALTTTANPEAGNLASRPVMSALERLFAESAAEKFGFRTVAVTGKPSWPEMVDGAKAHWVGEGQGVEAEPIQTTTKTPEIHTATARYLLSRQSVKENPALESVLRRDLQEVMREAVDWVAFNGKGGTTHEPAGLLTQLDAAGRFQQVGTTLAFQYLLGYAVQLLEASKLADLSKVRIAGAPILLEMLASVYVTGTAVSSLDQLEARFGKLILSSQVSPTADRNIGKAESNVFLGAPEGLALIPTWGAPELIVDPYSESRSGKVALTVFTFVDVLIQRLNTHFFALTEVHGY